MNANIIDRKRCQQCQHFKISETRKISLQSFPLLKFPFAQIHLVGPVPQLYVDKYPFTLIDCIYCWPEKK